MNRLVSVFSVLVTTCVAGVHHPAIEYIFPVPHSDLLTSETTVFLRLEASLHEQIDDVSNFINVSEHGSGKSGRVFFATDGQTIIYQPASRFDRGSMVDVIIKTSLLGYDDFSFSFETWANEPNDPSPPESTPAVLHQHSSIVPTTGSIRHINGVAVPSDFPRIETFVYGETAPGDIFMGTNFTQEGIGNYIIICNNEGTPLFYRRFENAGKSCANFVVHPTGHFSAYLFSPDYNVILDENFDIIEYVKPGHGYHGDDHEFIILENGHILLTCEEYIPIDLSQVVEGGRRDARVQVNMFQELDADRNVIFEWRSWDHFDLLDNQVANLTNKGIDYVHLNSIAIDYDGHVVISSKHLHEITKINRSTGEILWRFGGKNNQFDILNDNVPFTLQHTLRPVPGKPSYYTMFDNGGARSPNYARAVEYKIDPDAMTAEKVWEYRYNPDRHSSMMGSVQRLPNGNTYIDWSTTPPMKASEVTPDGDLVFDIYSYGASTYRSHRFEWHGTSRVPYFILENAGNVINLIFNKFGDDTVDYYKIYHGTSEHPTTVLDTTSATSYKAFDLENDSRHYFRITAVNVNGDESDFSEELNTMVRYTPDGENLIKNGDFASKAGWTVVKENGAIGAAIISDENELIVRVHSPGLLPADFQIQQKSLLITRGQTYKLEFDAYAENTRPIQLYIGEDSAPFTDYARLGSVALSTRKKNHSFTFTMQNNNDTNAMISFYCGQFDGDVILDNVSLKKHTTDVEKPGVEKPADYVLSQNYPNPFNPRTTIRYDIPKTSVVKINLYNVVGKLVKKLVTGQYAAGTHEFLFDASDMASGIYFYSLEAQAIDGSETTSGIKKMMLVR